MSKNQSEFVGKYGRLVASALAAIILAAATISAALPEGRSVDIHIDNGDIRLSLPGIQDATYDIQVKSSLSGTWGALETIRGQDGLTVFPLSPDDSPSRFFRVLFPQPTVTAGEPVFVPEEGGTTVYITGQFFYPGDQISLGGVLLSNLTFISSSLLSGILPDLSPGLHAVAVVSGSSGAMLANLPDALEVSPPLERTLQGPAEWPPAGPAPALPKHRGHVTVLKSHGGGVDEDCDGLPARGQGHVGHVNVLRSQGGGHVTVLKNRGLYDDDDGDESVLSRAKVIVRGWDPRARRLDDDSDDDGLEDGNGVDDDCDSPAGLALYAGEVRLQAVDLAVPGRGLDFVWTRTYRSRTGTATPQGSRWSHSYDVRCMQNGSTITVYDGTGRKDTFRIQPDGSYTCPEFFREGTLDAATGTFRLTFADAGYWEFNPFGASPFNGKLAQIVDRNGNTMTLGYDGAGRLTVVVDDLGRTNSIAYTPAGQIASVTDFSGRTVLYEYDVEGNLTACVSPAVTGTSTGNDFPNGKTNHYVYSSGHADDHENHLLLSVMDAHGHTSHRYVYQHNQTEFDFLRCVSLQRWTNTPARVTYLAQVPSPDNRFAALRCIVNDPEGNVSEAIFDVRNRCVARREFTGRATPGQPVTDTLNRPYGKFRTDDPDFFESRWKWNNDSLCTVWQRPLTNRVEWVYQADLDTLTPPRQRGNLREERRIANGDVDGDGRADVAVFRFEHDPRFGTRESTSYSATFSDGRYVLRTGVPLRGGTLTVRPPRITMECEDFILNSFPARIINPRGFETRCDYDTHGNLVNLTRHDTGDGSDTPPVLAREEFAFNAYGQLTAINNAEDGEGRRRVDTFSYHSSGPQRGYLQQAVADAGPAGRNLTTSYEYDTRGNLTRHVDPRGTATDIEVNALNQRIGRQTQGATFGERVRAVFHYDAANNLVRKDVENRAPDGTLDPANPQWTTTTVYDALKRPVQITQEISPTGQPGVLTNRFIYNANDNLVLHRLPEACDGSEPDNVIAYAYDERGLLLSKARAPGTGLSALYSYDYDGNGNLLRFTQSETLATTYSERVYDGFDRCVKTIDPMGNVATFRYDASGNRIYTKVEGELIDLPGGALNRTLAETSFSYDPLNRLTARTGAFFDLATGQTLGDGSSATSGGYAPNGQLVFLTDDNGHTTSYAYDSVGRLASVVDPKGNANSCTYDGNGNILTALTTDRSDVSAGVQLFTQTFTHDALNRCVSVIDNVGNTVSNAYDSSHNMVRTTDASGNESTFVADGLGRITDTTHYDGAKERGITINTTHVEYRNNRLVSTTDGNGHTTAYAYDACDRRVAVMYPDGTVEAMVWTPRGSLARYTDAAGTSVTNLYDLRGRLIRREIAVGEGVMDTTTFETYAYDGLGRLVATGNDSSELSFGYDSLGNRVSSEQDGLLATGTYDGAGNRLTLTYPGGRTVLTDYDALNLPTAISTRATPESDTTGLTTLAYDGADRLAKITRANTINTRVFWNGEQNTANADNDFGWRQVARVNHARAGGGQVIDQRNSGYDRAQNRILRSMTAPWTSGGALTDDIYGYDSLHRLTRSLRSNTATGESLQNYVLDANGNRLQVTNNGVAEVYLMDATLPEPADFPMNQYTEVPGGTLNYDANGNRISRTDASGSLFYYYDYANRLVQVDALDGDGVQTPVATYRYTPVPVSRRIGKTTPLLRAGQTPTVTTTTYLYDHGGDDDCDGRDDDCDATARGNLLETYVDGALQRTFVMPHVLEGAASVGIVFDETGAPFFYHGDDAGSLIALTDANGAVVERFDYDAFGAPSFLDAGGLPRADASASLSGVPQLFHGMQWDEETGLYCMDKAELVDLILKNRKRGAAGHFDPATGALLGRALPLGSATSRIREGGRTVSAGQIIEIIKLADCHTGGGGGAGKANFAFQFVGPGSEPFTGSPAALIVPVAINKGLRFTARTGRNPQTGKEIKIAAKKVAKFKAGKALADTVK